MKLRAMHRVRWKFPCELVRRLLFKIPLLQMHRAHAHGMLFAQ